MGTKFRCCSVEFSCTVAPAGCYPRVLRGEGFAEFPRLVDFVIIDLKKQHNVVLSLSKTLNNRTGQNQLVQLFF